MGYDDNQTINSMITIRRMDLDERDRARVAELAERDSHESLTGPILGIEVEGTLLAATSLDGGDSIADPFSRTAELRKMLELRATQLRRRKRRERSGRRQSRPAVGGSPPGQIIHLPRWG